MSRFREDRAFRPTSGNAGGSAVYGDLAQRLGSFANTLQEEHRAQRIRDAQADAAKADPRKLELKNNDTVYGAEYNRIAKQAYLANMRNDYSRNLQRIATENPDNPVAYLEKTQAYRSEMMNNAPEEVRAFAGLDFDATSNQFLFDIQKTHARDTIAAGKLEIASAMSSLEDDAMASLRAGDDASFLARREAYAQFVTQQNLSDLEKVKAIQIFDQRADLSYHMGEVERRLGAGDVSGALKYKRQLQQGKFKTFGKHSADRDQVMAELDKSINNYFSDERQMDAHTDNTLKDHYEANATQWLVDFQSGKRTSADLQAMLARREVDLSTYNFVRGLSATKAAATEPNAELEFSVLLGRASQTEVEDFVMNGVEQGRIAAKDAAAMVTKARGTAGDTLNTPTAKRELAWLRAATGMDKDFIDMTNAQQVMNAEALRRAQDAILDNQDPRQAVEDAFSWWKTVETSSFVTEFGLIRTLADVEAAAEKLRARIQGEPTQEQVRQIHQLQETKARMLAQQVRIDP